MGETEKKVTVTVNVEEDNQSLPRDENRKQKVATRRPTTHVPSVVTNVKFQRLAKWWLKPSIIFAFRHPHVRSKLEKLMGSNTVSLTDRAYMLRLQSRILEDYATAMDKRIKVREADEMERVKNLVLTGRIPLDQAPPEMANHPVMLIEMYCRKLIAERRAKIKVLKVKIPRHLYWDDTPDPPSGLSIEKGHVFRKPHEKLCFCPDKFVAATDEEEVEAGYMFTPEEYQKLKFENADVTALKNSETVEEMYDLADSIVGDLQMAEQMKFEDVVSTSTTLSAITGRSVATTATANTRASVSAEVSSTTGSHK